MIFMNLKSLLLFKITIIIMVTFQEAKSQTVSNFFFQFDNVNLRMDFEANKIEAEKLDSIAYIEKRNIDVIEIIGSASNEGDYNYNKNLAYQRAVTLKRYLSAKFYFVDSVYSIRAVVAKKSIGDLKKDRFAKINISLKQNKEAKETLDASSKVNLKRAENTNIIKVLPLKKESGLHINWKYIAYSCLLLLIILFICIVIYFNKVSKGIIIVFNKIGGYFLLLFISSFDIIIVMFGKQKKGGILPKNGNWEGKGRKKLYVMPKIPQNRGSNSEGRTATEILRKPFIFPPSDIKNPIARKEMEELERRCNKNKYRGISYINGRPDFSKFSLPFIYTKITKSRNDNQTRGIKILAKRWRCGSLKDAQKIKAKYDLVFHEVIYNILGIKVGVLQIIPNNIHENAPHTGGVSDAEQ